MNRFFNRQRISATIAMLAMSIGLTSWTNADLVNVDIDLQGNVHTFSGAAAVGSGGDVWNSLAIQHFTQTAWSESSLVNSAGATTGTAVSFTKTGVPFAANYIGGSDLLGDYYYLFDTNDSATITVSGLKPNTNYDLYLYSSAGAGNGGKFTFDSTLKTTNGNYSGSFVEGDNYVHYASVLSSGAGTITGLEELNGTYGIFNGLQIQGEFYLPEPASFVLAAVAIPLLRRRRR